MQTGHCGHAFVQFDSERTAENVLGNFEETPTDFLFCGRRLRIGRCKKSRQQLKATVVDQLINNNTSDAVNFSIGNVHYGTLITGAAMNNITDTNNADDFGFIAHRLVNNEQNISIYFRIDEQEKKISIIVSYKSLSSQNSSNELTFEWAFGA